MRARNPSEQHCAAVNRAHQPIHPQFGRQLTAPVPPTEPCRAKLSRFHAQYFLGRTLLGLRLLGGLCCRCCLGILPSQQQ